MIDELKQNIESEIGLLREISNNLRRIEYANISERKLLINSNESLKSSFKLINDAIPKILADISIAQPLTKPNKGKSQFTRIEYESPESSVIVTLPEQDKESFIRKLNLNYSLLKRLKKKGLQTHEEEAKQFKASRGYIKLANKFFLEYSQKLISKGNFKPLSLELKKANMDILFSAYISLMFFSVFASFIASIFLTITALFFKISLVYPFFQLYEGSYLIRIAQIFWIPLAIPCIVFFILYYYPSTEKDSKGKKIDQELPFAVIQMGAVSGSGIEPTQIFKIVAFSKEYPNLRREIRKVLNQINLFGYDLVTALNNVSKTTPSSRLSELFSGLSTTITSGGNLSDFFQKRSETLMVSYKLDREKFTKMAETFMDMYISIVIAAPMILMILLVMLSVTGTNLFSSPEMMTISVVMIISLINIVFLVFLHIKQPNY